MRRWLPILIVSLLVGVAPAIAQEAAEEEEIEPAWKGSLGLSWVATSGNTDTSSFGLDFGLDRKAEPWGLGLVVKGNRSEDQGARTAENYLVSGRAVRKLGERWEAFGGLAWAKDPFAGFDSQTVASVGATYIAINSERHLLSFDAGLTYTWEDQISPVAPAPTISTESIDFAGGLLGLKWDWKLSDNATFLQRLVLLPNFDETSDWRLNSTTALEAAVNSWLAVRLGLDVRYRNEPIGDAKSTDTTSTASVVFNF
jgi:putative salt-induced outer membrane protein